MKTIFVTNTMTFPAAQPLLKLSTNSLLKESACLFLDSASALVFVLMQAICTWCPHHHDHQHKRTLFSIHQHDHKLTIIYYIRYNSLFIMPVNIQCLYQITIFKINRNPLDQSLCCKKVSFIFTVWMFGFSFSTEKYAQPSIIFFYHRNPKICLLT